MNRRVVVAASVDINTRASSLCNRALCNGPVSVGEHAQPSGYRFFLRTELFGLDLKRRDLEVHSRSSS